MNDFLLVALALSWVAIIGLGIMLYALTRQIGLLHERIKPVGALSLGKALEVGEEAPVFEEPSITGGVARIGGEHPDRKATLLFFMSSTCPVCKTLLPILTAISRQERDWLTLTFASDGGEKEHRPVIADNKLQDYPYLLSMDVGMAYQITKLPYGVLIGPDGTIAAHGLINNREHLESLFEAYSRGIAHA